MTNVWSESYKDKILDLLPLDGSLVKAGKIYKKSNFSTVTVSKYLKMMCDDGIIERIQTSQKNVSYRRLERIRLQRLIENFADELERSIVSIPKNVSNDVNVLADQLAKDFAGGSRNEPFGFDYWKEGFKNDKDLIEVTLLYNIISYMFRIVRMLTHIEIAKSEDFYVDSFGNFVPKKLVDERINPSEITEWKYDIAFHERTLKIIREGVNNEINRRLKEKKNK